MFLSAAVIVGFIIFSTLATPPTFTNNGAPAGTFNRGATSNLALDITLPPIDTDIFLDGDGTATAGPGPQEAISPLAPLLKLSLPSGTGLCGDTDGSASPPTSIVHDADGSCTSGSGARIVVLGSDSGATNNLAGTNTLIGFRDAVGGSNPGLGGDKVWQSGEDLYLDVDTSRRYNADNVDAVTVKNLGTAISDTDITLVKLWAEWNGNNHFDTDDLLLSDNCSFNATTTSWECDTGFGISVQTRIYVTVDLALNATVGHTIQMQVPGLVDVGTPSVFNPGDQGIFFSDNTEGSGSHDGPATAITNANIQTIGSGITPGFELVGTLPAATNYTGDSTGKILGDLTAFGSKLYIGYGYAHAGNSYHTSINYWDGSAFQTPLDDFAAEAIFLYRVLDGKIHAPAADESGHSLAKGEPWAASGDPNIHRGSDVADGINPGEIFFSGAAGAGQPGDDPTIWRSTNNGSSWSVSLRPVDNDSGYCCPNMPSFVVNYNGAVWTDSYMWPAAYKWDGSQWIQQAFHIGTLHRPLIFNGLVVARDFGFSYCCGNPNDDAGRLYKFDATATSQSLGRSAYDIEVHGPYLYSLDEKRRILRTSDLENFTFVAQAPIDGYSIGFLGDDLYVGGANGKLYKYQVTIEDPPEDTIPPSVAITAPSDNATVSGTFMIKAQATDDTGVSKVEFLVDGQIVNTDTASPYEHNWNTTTVPNGTHTLLVRAFDLAGNVATSAAVRVNVSNQIPPPPPLKPGDVNGDGVINIFDLSILLSNWSQLGDRTKGDLNGDGVINIFDLSILLSNWGK